MHRQNWRQLLYYIFTLQKYLDFTWKVLRHPIATTVLFSKQRKSTKKNIGNAHIPSIHAKKATHLLS